MEKKWSKGDFLGHQKSHIRVIANTASYAYFHKHIEFIMILSNFYNDVFNMIISVLWTEKNLQNFLDANTVSYEIHTHHTTGFLGRNVCAFFRNNI